MADRLKKYLFDIESSILSIYEFIGSKTFDEYMANKLLKRAVEREFEIIGEALNNIVKNFPEINVSNSRRIIDFRNYLIHGYADVSDKIVWSIFLNDLQILKDEIQIFLKE
jgi:uncharacterized protein with HEPN domain